METDGIELCPDCTDRIADVLVEFVMGASVERVRSALDGDLPVDAQTGGLGQEYMENVRQDIRRHVAAVSHGPIVSESECRNTTAMTGVPCENWDEGASSREIAGVVASYLRVDPVDLRELCDYLRRAKAGFIRARDCWYLK